MHPSVHPFFFFFQKGHWPVRATYSQSSTRSHAMRCNASRSCMAMVHVRTPGPGIPPMMLTWTPLRIGSSRTLEGRIRCLKFFSGMLRRRMTVVTRSRAVFADHSDAGLPCLHGHHVFRITNCLAVGVHINKSVGRPNGLDFFFFS